MSSKHLINLAMAVVFGLVLNIFTSQIVHAQSGNIDWKGWKFGYEIGNELDGVAITNVTFQGKQIMGRGSFPAMPVYYENNACGPYLDRLDVDLAVVPWANDATVVSREFTINGEQWYELGIRQFIGQYDIYQVWYFNGDGIVDAHLFSRGLQCQVDHVHYPQWRFDFDINGSANDQILRQTSSGLAPYQTEFNVKANSARNHGWVVRDTPTGDYVEIDFDSGAWNVSGTVVPESSYSKNRVAGRLRKDNEVRWHTTGHASLPATWNNRIGYGGRENISNKDVVLWYSGYLPHTGDEGASLWHSTGVRISVFSAQPTPTPPSGSPEPTFTHPDNGYDGVSGDTIPHGSALGVAANNRNFSVEFCIQPEQGATGKWRSVVHKGAADNQRTFGMWLRPGDMRLHYRISTSTNLNAGGDSVAALALNQPTKVTYVRDGNKLKLYLNGVLDSEATLGGTVISNTGPLYIGDSPWDPGTKGQIGGFSLYNQAITPTAGSCSISAETPPTGNTVYRYVRLVAESEMNGGSWTSMAEFNVLNANGNTLNRAGWTVTANSEETVGESGQASNVLDGNADTWWHTEWQEDSPNHPHQIIVDMGSAQNVGGFRYLPRPGGGNGSIAAYKFYVSTDGVNWGSPVAQGTFANNADEKTVRLR